MDRSDGFITDVKEATRPERWKLAFESRHDSWYDDHLQALLDDRRAALVVNDMWHKGGNDRENEGSFVYVRRHGPGGDMAKGYGEEQLRADQARVEGWLEAGRTSMPTTTMT